MWLGNCFDFDIYREFGSRVIHSTNQKHQHFNKSKINGREFKTSGFLPAPLFINSIVCCFYARSSEFQHCKLKHFQISKVQLLKILNLKHQTILKCFQLSKNWYLQIAMIYLLAVCVWSYLNSSKISDNKRCNTLK